MNDLPEYVGEVPNVTGVEDHRFHVDGGSWTHDVSWVRGHQNVLGPLEQVSARFAEVTRRTNVPMSDPRFRNALFHLMAGQTSCFRS